MHVAQAPRLSLDARWLDAIPARRSHRSFDGRPIAPAVLERIDAACERLSAQARGGVRAELVWAVPEGVFKGVVGSYGAISGAAAFAAFIGRSGAERDVGYLGEAVVLEATAAGLDTCWVAGSFDPGRTSRLLALDEGEAVRAVSPLGHGARRRSPIDFLAQVAVRARSRLPLATIAPGYASWPEWMRAAAQAVRLAPSGKNDQPWRLRREGDALVVGRKAGKSFWTAPFDGGIAMLHAELGAMGAGVTGRWEGIGERDFGRLVPSPACDSPDQIELRVDCLR